MIGGSVLIIRRGNAQTFIPRRFFKKNRPVTYDGPLYCDDVPDAFTVRER